MGDLHFSPFLFFSFEVIVTFILFFMRFWNQDHGGSRWKETALVHNCPALHAKLHQEAPRRTEGLLGYQVKETKGGGLHFDTADEAEYPSTTDFLMTHMTIWQPSDNHLKTMITDDLVFEHNAREW